MTTIIAPPSEAPALIPASPTQEDNPQEDSGHELVLSSSSSSSVEEVGEKEDSMHQPPAGPFDQIVVQANAIVESVTYQFEQVQSRFVLDRPFIMSCIITAIVFCTAVGCMFIGTVLVVALISSPLWLPLTVVTSPLWMTTLFVSSPVWVTILVITAVCLICTTVATSTLVLFFAWPEEWLPSPQGNTVVCTFLDTRKCIEMHLIKFQAKFLLYCAGVGPAADTAFLIIDRVDINAVRERLSKVDIEKLKQLDPSELQTLIFEAVQALTGSNN